MDERIGVVGAGYVGLVTAACLADLGRDIVVVDVDRHRIEQLQQGVTPVHEEGLPQLLARTASRIRFTSDYAALADLGIVVLCVGTPPLGSGGLDLANVRHAAQSAAAAMAPDGVIAIKSTVPAGTGRLLRSELARTFEQLEVVSNPEFLREGSAVHDFLHPDRVVVGGDEPRSIDRVAALYGSLGAPIVRTDPTTAELTKLAANAFLALKVSFINEVSHLASAVDADVTELAAGLGLDPRIGPHFLRAGLGFGGSCLPKDIAALATLAEEHGLSSAVARAAERTNLTQRTATVATLRDALGGLSGRRLGVLGLAFKPGTDDVRASPALDLIELAMQEGASVTLADPVALPYAERSGLNVTFARDLYACADGADALVLVTDWPAYAQPEWSRVRRLMRGDLVFDGRLAWAPRDVAAAGLRYAAFGRRGLPPAPVGR